METSPLRRWPRADLRVGDDDRQRVVDELQRHYIAGRLTSEELGERVSHALAAKTFGDLATILSDLPDEHPEPALSPVEPEHARHGGEPNWFAIPPIVLILVAVCLVTLVVTLTGALGPRGTMGLSPFLLAFFIFGWPRGGRRRHF